MNGIQQVSLLWLLPVLLVPVVVYRGFRILLNAKADEYQLNERDWTVPQLEFTQGEESPIHCWDVRFKLGSFLFLSFMIVSLQHIHMAIVALLLALACYRLTDIPWQRGGKRLLGMTGFLAMFLLMLPLTAVPQAGDQVFIFGQIEWLRFNLRGLDLAILIILRASAVALLMEPMLATAPLPETLAGLERMGVPRRLTELLLICHRYLHVFIHEAQRMHIGMEVRGFRKTTSVACLRTVGNFVGMLFVRSFERTERVHTAMLARGYQGRWPQPVTFSSGKSDYFKAAIVVCFGLLLVVYDQLL